MKAYILYSLLVLYLGGTQARFNLTVLTEEWHKFKIAFGKEYKTVAEEVHRMNVFIENKLKIDEHNRRYEEGLVSFTVGLNQFGDLTTEDFDRMLKINKFENINLMTRQKFMPRGDIQLPEYVDWREIGVVTPVGNQFYCGSCYAFSVVGSIESHYSLKTGQLLILSKQQILDCSENYGNSGCRGGRSDASYEYIIENGGLLTEAAYPYAGVQSTCKYNSTNGVAKITSFADIESGNEQHLQAAVATMGPISAAMKAGPMFSYYSGGIYDAVDCIKPSDALDHVILIVGYGQQFGVDYWLLKNSWGSQWGESGYMKLRRNVNMCGIALSALFPIV